MDLQRDSPMLQVTDPFGRPLRWALIRAPLVTRDSHLRLAQLSAQRYRFGGITSYMGFPGDSYRDERDYGSLCEVWLHCFRDPSWILPRQTPSMLISESDFTDPRTVDPARMHAPQKLRSDVVYVCSSQPWKQHAKNWPLARRALPRIVQETGMRVSVIDAPADAEPIEGVQFHGPLPWQQLLAVIASARCVFVPSVLDPSPRVMAEALCLNTPVVVNRRIVGGWKYVNLFTGEFFDDVDDVADAVRRAVNVVRHPRSWFTAHHGPARAGRQTLELLRSVDPDLPDLTHVLLAPDDAHAESAGQQRH